MATTISYFIKSKPKKDGTFPVVIRITHNRKSRYLPTSIYVSRAQIARDGAHIKDVDVEDAVNARVMDLKQAFLNVQYAEFLTIDQLVDAISGKLVQPKAFRLDLFDFAASQMVTMEPKTAEGYQTSLNAVKRFIRKDRLDINEITKAWVRQFREFLETEPAVQGNGMTYRKKSRGCRAVSYYLGCIRHLHNQARMIYNDDDNGTIVIPRQPFADKNIIPRQPLTDHRVLTIAQIRKIMNVELKPGSRAEMARDVFMLSFALAGTNTVDIYKMKHSSLNGDLLTFNRSKTEKSRQDHARITLKVLPIAKAMIEKYAATDGERLMMFSERYCDSKGFCRACDLGLKVVAKKVGIAESLTTYYYRHSWATIARNVCRIDFDTVNAGLNHVHRGSDRIGDVYIARDYSAIWEAQEAVMAEVTKTVNSDQVLFSAAV